MSLSLKSILRGALSTAVAAAFISVAVPSQTAQAQEVDMKKMFRCQAKDKSGVAACDKSRAVILNNCTTCHIFVAIVVQQFDQEGWDGLFERHKDRVPQLDTKTLTEMKTYLAANFNPQLDPPEVPPELLKEWTAY